MNKTYKVNIVRTLYTYNSDYKCIFRTYEAFMKDEDVFEIIEKEKSFFNIVDDDLIDIVYLGNCERINNDDYWKVTLVARDYLKKEVTQ